VQRAPGLPCALSLWGQGKQQTSGESRRENANPYSVVIAKAGIQCS
jgi:hypothetical protein